MKEYQEAWSALPPHPSLPNYTKAPTSVRADQKQQQSRAQSMSNHTQQLLSLKAAGGTDCVIDSALGSGLMLQLYCHHFHHFHRAAQ